MTVSLWMKTCGEIHVRQHPACLFAPWSSEGFLSLSEFKVYVIKQFTVRRLNYDRRFNLFQHSLCVF